MLINPITAFFIDFLGVVISSFGFLLLKLAQKDIEDHKKLLKVQKANLLKT